MQGHCDESTLTAAGRESARQVGVALNGLAFDALYSSPLKRAKDTAEIIVSGLTDSSHPSTLTLSDHLKEINLVLWEAMLFQDVEAKYPEGFRLWNEKPHELCMTIPGPAGPVDFYPVPALYDQARQFWQEILPQHGGQTILVVAHSGINRALISTAIGLMPASYQAVQQHNCAISVLNFGQPLPGQGPIPPVQLESLNLTSHLGEPLPPRRHNSKGTRFLLVRHGETDWNRQKRFQGQIDVPLNDTGRQQSQQAGEFLKDIPLDFAVSSPMLRPRETAEIILQHHLAIQLEFQPDLCEISHGLWEGKLEAEIEAEYPGLLHQWQQAPETVQMPEGENLQQVWERAIAAWEAIVQSIAARATAAQPSTVLVVAHDAINKAILCHILGLGPEHFWNFRQGNGAVSVIDYSGGPDSTPALQAMNITTHLAGGILDKTAAGAL